MLIGLLMMLLFASLVLMAGFYFLSHVKKENLSKSYSVVAYGVITFSLLVILIGFIGGICVAACKGCHGNSKCKTEQSSCGSHGMSSCDGQSGATCPMKGGNHCSEMKGGNHCSEMKGGSHCSEMKGGSSCSGMGKKSHCGMGGETEVQEIIIEKRIENAPGEKEVQIKVEAGK